MKLHRSHTELSTRETKPRSPSFFAHYYSVFEPLAAVTPELKREAYRIRYQVYCVEHNFEDPAQNPDGLERDEYDGHAAHGILRHRATDATMGAVRLVLNDPSIGWGSLPIHSICSESGLADLMALPLQSTAEISRFSVSKAFCRRAAAGHGGNGQNSLDREGGPSIPHIALGLLAVALQLGMDHGIDYVCAIMEPALIRMLARLGAHFRPLGPLVDYHGQRQPCYSDVDELFGRLQRECPDVWDIITDRGRLWQANPHSLALAG